MTRTINPIITTLTVGAAVLLAACGPKLARLDAQRVAEMSLSLVDGERSFCNLAIPQLRATVTYTDGTRLSTWADKKTSGALAFSDFLFSPTLGAIDDNGYLLLPDNQLKWLDKQVTIDAALIARRDMTAQIVLTPRYDCGGTIDFRGQPGRDGGTGTHGEDGMHGPDVEIALTYVQTANNGRLVLARARIVDDPREPAYVLIDTRGPVAPTFIDASGGRGGNGGAGEDGEAGHRGEHGQDGDDGDDGDADDPCGDGQDGGNGGEGGDGSDAGDGGDGGHGGHGGRIFIDFDGRFPELANVFRYRIDGGEGGKPAMGGTGGPGGEGGDGGRGGDPGEATDPRAMCRANAGQSGQDGMDGRAGQDGRSGRAGVAGQVGSIQARPVPVSELFTSELAASIPIVADASEQPGP